MARKAGAGELVLVGGKTAQVRKPTERSWTKAKETKFLSVLAETCNVSLACEGADVSNSQAYRRRKSDAAFRAGWMDAIGAAYQRLELVLLERALNGTEKIVIKTDGREERMREYPNQIALTLLRMHRDTASEAEAEIAPDDVEEIRARLIGKLERLRAREEKASPAE
jgi:hypothetical protein